MHEMSIVLSILDIASEESEHRGAAMINAIHIRLGPLSGVAKEALLSAFDLARECSPFGKCRLVIEDVPVTVNCPTCQAVRLVESIQMMRCSSCGTPTGSVASGNEMEITAMEIEEPSATEREAVMQSEA
jgi:hydrogenase nickel incorporation protein HypA/HybF